MKRILKALRSGGWRHAARIVGDRVDDFWAERRLGISARGLIPIETLLENWKDCHDYFPTTVSSFHQFMRHVEMREGEDVFVDMGCGMGRVLVLAAQYRFQKIIGVEVSAELARQARRNIANCRIPLACRNIEIWTGDARDYPIPPNATVFYFYNPFHGAILKETFGALEKSLEANPRQIRVVFNNAVHFEKMERGLDWLVRIKTLQMEHECVILRNSRAVSGCGSVGNDPSRRERR